jgi:hypothetical protein
VPGLFDATFADHCLVMSRKRIIFDPAVSLPAPPGLRVATWSVDDIVYGISFEQREVE